MYINSIKSTSSFTPNFKANATNIRNAISVVGGEFGLHLRPLSLIVKEAQQGLVNNADAYIHIQKVDENVKHDASSILEMMTACFPAGTKIKLIAKNFPELNFNNIMKIIKNPEDIV